MNNVKFAIIEMKTSCGQLTIGSQQKALIYGNTCCVIDGIGDGAYPATFLSNQFTIIKEFSGNEPEVPKELTGLASLMGQKMKSAHFEFTE